MFRCNIIYVRVKMYETYLQECSVQQWNVLFDVIQYSHRDNTYHHPLTIRCSTINHSSELSGGFNMASFTGFLGPEIDARRLYSAKEHNMEQLLIKVGEAFEVMLKLSRSVLHRLLLAGEFCLFILFPPHLQCHFLYCRLQSTPLQLPSNSFKCRT